VLERSVLAILSLPRLVPDGVLDGQRFDRLLTLNVGIVFALFVVSQVLLVAVLFRRKPARGRHSPRRALLLKYIPLAGLCALYVWMAFTAEKLWAASRFEGPSLTALQVEVTGVQFQWYFRYPGSDQAFGVTRPGLVDPAGGNPLGIDPRDAHGSDDVVSSVLVLPAGREVDLRLRAQDVIHGFFIPGMRLKQNAVPGLLLHVHFTPAKVGDYPILCSQLCGLGHQRMQALLRVVPPKEFQTWMAQREAR
jgi:cytochrome c oxidase subunit 2